MQLPIVDDKGFHGVVDLVTMKAYLYEPDGSGMGEVGRFPKPAMQMRRPRMRPWWSWWRRARTS